MSSEMTPGEQGLYEAKQESESAAVNDYNIIHGDLGELAIQLYTTTYDPMPAQEALKRMKTGLLLGQAELDKTRAENASLRAALADANCALVYIRNLSDVGMLFDGHDELNEDTHEGNEVLLTGSLDDINAIARQTLAAREGGGE